MSAIDRYLQDVLVLKAEGWTTDDITALSAHEVEVLAHVARLPELVDLSVGTSSGELFILARAQLEAGRQMAPQRIASILPPTVTRHPSPSSTRPHARLCLLRAAWRWVRRREV